MCGGVDGGVGNGNHGWEGGGRGDAGGRGGGMLRRTEGIERGVNERDGGVDGRVERAV